MAYQTDLPFCPKPSTIMHLDMNSCFASVEQQANPLLRNKPIAVAAYDSPGGCIIAPSVEAKKLGIKVGLRVKDGRLLCPQLIVLAPDPWKYRCVHLAIKKILQTYTDQIYPKSIDEFVLDFEGYPAVGRGMIANALEIKQRIKNEVGDWLRVSIGIGPSRFLAKLAAGWQKPDGLTEINKDNYFSIYQKLNLTDLGGIKQRNALRLNKLGIFSVWDFYRAGIDRLKAAFNSICGYYWYLRMHGWEIDDFESTRRSYGNSYALPKPLVTPSELTPIMQKLVEKTGSRLRQAGWQTRGVHLSLLYRDWSFWHRGRALSEFIFDSTDIYQEVFWLLRHCPYKKPVREIAVSVFNLSKRKQMQLDLFGSALQKEKLVEAIDKINQRFGNFVITPGRMILARTAVPDRIAFGGVKELEEFTIT